MKNAIKTIVCGFAAIALFACSSDNASAPEQAVSQTSGNNEEQQHARVNSTDETDSIPESWLEGYSLSKMIMVDHRCVESPEHPDNPMWCLPHRVQLESGTVANMYWGTSDYIRCELAEDTLTYRENLSSDDSTVSKKLSRNAAKYVTGIEEAFRDSCEAEGGTFIDTNEDALECEVKTKPLECEGCPKDIARTYSDPYWRPFAEMVISPCRIRPQIEPIE